MSPEELMLEWLYWHHAVEYMKQDLSVVESMDLRFPHFAGWALRKLGSQVYANEQLTAKELKANGIRITKEKLDRGELIVVWAHRGNTDIFRISEGKLRVDVQRKINELMAEMMSEKKDDPSPK